MADGTITVTIDTDEWSYPDNSGIPHVVTDAETFTLTSVDNGDGATYTPDAGQNVACTDGSRLFFIPDPNHDSVTTAGDTAVTNDNKTLGEWSILCTADGQITRWKCTGMDVNDADAVTSFTTATFEVVGNNARTFTWSGVDAAFA